MTLPIGWTPGLVASASIEQRITFIAKTPARLLMCVLLPIMIEEKIVARRFVTLPIARADPLLRISVEEKHAALSAESPVPLARASRIIKGKIIWLHTSCSFLGRMWLIRRYAIDWAAAFIPVSVEE
jgi:hypothetical protein